MQKALLATRAPTQLPVFFNPPTPPCLTGTGDGIEDIDSPDGFPGLSSKPVNLDLKIAETRDHVIYVRI